MDGQFDFNEFDYEFEENRKRFKDEPEKAHEAQVKLVKKLDDFTGGKSLYNEKTGVWTLSDGRQSDLIGNGITGNSLYKDSFDYKKTKAYKDYTKKRDSYLNEEFSYNPKNDKVYKSYEKMYKDNGRKAMEDTIARLSTMTGGIASSYAVSSGANAYNEYMGRLSDEIPELYEKNYEKFKDKKARELNDMELLKEEIDREEKLWKERQDNLKEETIKEEKKLSDYNNAMRIFQSDGADNMTEENWRAIYDNGGYYDPEKNFVYDKNGDAFAPALNKKTSYNGEYRLMLQEFQSKGFNGLTEKQKVLALTEGWYDADTGLLYDAEGNAYKSNYDPIQNALASYKTSGVKGLADEEVLRLEEEGYKIIGKILYNPSGRAV